MNNKKTILIVDDIEINREILSEIFKDDSCISHHSSRQERGVAGGI